MAVDVVIRLSNGNMNHLYGKLFETTIEQLVLWMSELSGAQDELSITHALLKGKRTGGLVEFRVTWASVYVSFEERPATRSVKQLAKADLTALC